MTDQKSSQENKPGYTIAYKGKMFEIATWEGRPGVQFESAIRAPGVRILIETEKDGMKALLMTKEKRHEINGYDFRLPGGKVFDSLDEFTTHRDSGADILPVAIIAAKKEAKEEAGISEGECELIEMSKAGASVEWDLFYFKITGMNIGEQELEASEEGNIETVLLSAEEIFEKLTRREIKEGRSADIVWSWLYKNGFIKFEV